METTLSRFRFSFLKLFFLLFSLGRCPPLKPLLPAQRVVEGADSNHQHPQPDQVLQPQPQAGGLGQAAGAPPLFGKPPELEEEDGARLVSERP